MPEDKKTFRVEGRVANIPVDKVDAFIEKYPEAEEAQSFMIGERKATVPLTKVDDFLKKYKDAKPIGVASPKTEPGLGKQEAGGMSDNSAGIKLPSSLTGDQLKRTISQYGLPLRDGLNFDRIATEVSGKSPQEAISIYKDYVLSPKKTSLSDFRNKLIYMGISEEEFTDDQIEAIVFSDGTLEEKVMQAGRVLNENRARLKASQKNATSPSEYFSPEEDVPTYRPEDVDFTLGSVISKIDMPSSSKTMHAYESNQILLSKIDDYLIDDPNNVPPPPPGPEREAWLIAKAAYNKETSSDYYSRYNQLKSSKGGLVEEAKNIVKSGVEEAVSLGGWATYYNYKTDRISQDKVDQAADAFAKENKLQIGGPSWMMFRGDLETAAKQQYLMPAIDNAIKPLVKEFESALNLEVEKLKPEFNKASKLIAERDLKIKSVGDQISQEANQEATLAQAEFKKVYDGLNAAFKSNNDAYVAKREEFQKAVDANLMSVEDANAALEKLSQESEQVQQEIIAQWAQTNQEELSKYNNINSRYNARYARQQELIINATKDEVNKEFSRYIKNAGVGDKLQKEFEAKIASAVNSVIQKRDKDLVASERAAITALSSVLPMPALFGLNEYLATAIPSTISSFGNYIEGIGYSMENPTLMKLGGYMAESYKLQPAEETLQGMADAQNYGKITGNVMGSQVFPIGTGLLTAVISKNPTLAAMAATAGAVVNFSSETATIAGNVKKQILENTGSYSKAMEGYSQAIDSQIALSPTYLVEMLPFVSNFYKVFGKLGSSMAGRAITGGLTELTTEVVLQEYPQTVFEEAIIKGEDWRKAYGDAMVNLLSGNQAELDRFGKVAIASSPMFGMGAMGGIASANRSAQAEAKLKKSILAQISLSEYNDSIREQFVYSMVNEKGADFAISTLTQGYAGGLIDKATYDKLVASVTKSEAYAKTAKDNGLSQGQSTLYSAMAFQHDRLLEMARTSEDKSMASIYEARAREIQTDIRNILSGKTVNAAILKFGDKTSVVVTQDDIINRVANDPNFVDSLVDGGTRISLTSDIENFSADFVRAINTVEEARKASIARRQNAGAEAAGITPNAQVVAGLTETEVASRITAGQKIDDMSLATEAAPDEVVTTITALENESEENPITEQQAINASDWLYSRYKQLSQLKKSLQDRLATTTDKKQKTLLQKAINDLGYTLSSMGDDIATLSEKAKELSVERINNKGESPKRPYLTQATDPTGSTESNSKILKKAQWDPYSDKNYSNLSLDPNSFMAKALDKAFKLAEKLGINFYVYATESEYTAILPQSAGGFASIEKGLSQDGKSSWGIHINLEALRVAVETPEVFKNKYAGTALDRWYYKKLSGEQIFSNVLRHELGHGVLIKSFGENAAPLYKAIIKDLSKILPSDIIEAATAWGDAYAGEISFEEVITELQALMGTVEVKANPSVAAKILDRINKFIESIGKKLGLSKSDIEAIKIKSNLNKYIQLSDFLNNFSGFTKGDSFTELNPAFALAISEKYQAKDDSEIQSRRESRANKKAAISIGISPYAEDRIPRYSEIANQISLAKLNSNANRIKALTEELKQAVDDRLKRAIPNAKWKSTPIEGYWKGDLENSIFIEFEDLSDNILAGLAKIGLEFDQDEVHIRSIVGDSNEDYLSVQEDGSMLTVQAVIEFNSEKELTKIIPDIHSKYGIEGASIIGGKNLLVYLAESASLEDSAAQINDFKLKVERIVNENERSIRPFEGIFPTKLIRYSRGGVKGESISYKEAISNANISEEEREQINLSPEKTKSDLWANSILSSGQKMMINLIKPFNPKIGRLRKNEQTGVITREGGDRALIAKLTSVGEMFNAAPLFSRSKIVTEAYDALSKAINEQYKKLPIKAVPNSKAVELDNGEIVWIEDTTEPYKSSKEVFDDIEDNNNMVFFATNENTYGEKGIDYTGHPMLDKSGFKSASTPVYKGSVNKETGEIEIGEATGKFVQYELLNNDVLRVVHDFYAHATTDAQFGPRGEEKAWMAHVATILSENKISSRDKLLAIWALTSETRGQNTSVNFTNEWNDNVTYELDRARKLEAEGKIKEADDIRKEFTGDNGIRFADQKVALLPEEALFSDQQDGKSNDTLLAVLMRDNPDVVASVRKEVGGAERVSLDKTSTRQSNPRIGSMQDKKWQQNPRLIAEKVAKANSEYSKDESDKTEKTFDEAMSEYRDYKDSVKAAFSAGNISKEQVDKIIEQGIRVDVSGMEPIGGKEVYHLSVSAKGVEASGLLTKKEVRLEGMSEGIGGGDGISVTWDPSYAEKLYRIFNEIKNALNGNIDIADEFKRLSKDAQESILDAMKSAIGGKSSDIRAAIESNQATYERGRYMSEYDKSIPFNQQAPIKVDATSFIKHYYNALSMFSNLGDREWIALNNDISSLKDADIGILRGVTKDNAHGEVNNSEREYRIFSGDAIDNIERVTPAKPFSTRQSNPLIIKDKDITLAVVDLEGFNEGEEGFISDYEQLDKLDEVVRESGINILRNKELRHVALDKKGDPIAGLWVENDGDEFSFDIIVSEKHRRKGIAEALLNQAIADFEYESSINEEMGEDPLSYKVHAVNPNMENLLLRYGFIAEQELSDGSVIMTHPTNKPENRMPASDSSRQSTVNHTKYKPQQTAMASNEDFRAMQVRIYELAEKKFKELEKDIKEDKALAVSELMAALVEEDIYIDIPSASELYRDLISERNPIYVKKNGQWQLEYGRKGKSSVRSRVINGLLNLPASRKINRKIIDNMVKNLGYSVESQKEAEEVAEIFVEAMGGIEDLSIDELLSVTSELTGATRTLAMGKIASDAYKLGRQAKDSETRQKFRNISNSFLDILANQAIEDGRANAALYRLYMNNPEMIFALEHKKINAQSSRAMTDETSQNSKAKKVRKAQRAVKKAKVKAAKKAASSPKVKANTPKPQPSSTPAPSTPQSPSKPPTIRQMIAKKEKDVISFIKNKLGIRQARSLPSNLDPDVLDAIVELAREYISEYEIFDAGELFKKINNRFLKDGLDIMSINSDYFTYTWMEVEQNALAVRSEVLAKRLAAKITQRAKPGTAPKTFDPIAFMIDQLYGKATEGLPKKDVSKITPLEKVAEILRNFRDAKNIWESSKGKTEMMIDNLDPQKYTLQQKREMKEALQDYFDNDIDPLLIKATPYGNKQAVFQQMIKEELGNEGFDANEILLSAWDIQAENKADFIEKLIARITVAANGRLSQSQIDLLANSFAEEYDAILDAESIKALKKSLPRLKSEDKFEKDLRKETPEADRLFNLIKYGAFEPGKMEVTLPDGSLTDGAKLFAEMFNIPYADQDVIDALEVFAERISKTPANSVFRSSVYNEMMQFVKMIQAENQFSRFSILTAHFYSFILWSSDTIMKAFNSNALTFPYTTMRTVARNALTGKFYAAGLAAKGFYSTTGYSLKAEVAKNGAMKDSDGVPIRNGETYYVLGGGIISQNNPKYELLLPVIEGGKGTSVNKFSIGATEFFLAMTGKRETNVIETESVSEVLARNGKTKVARMWGKFTRLPGRLLSGVDMLTAAMATDGHTADLMYDLIDYTVKEYNKDNPQQNIRLSQSQKSELVKEILGDSGDSFLGAVIQALGEVYEIEQAKTPAEREAAVRKNKLMVQSRIKEITYQSIDDRAGELAAKYDYLSGLDIASLEKVIEDARWQSSKIGLMGTPEGTAGAVAVIQQYIGKFVPMSKFFIATFINAPTNFLSWAIKTNLVTGGVLLPIRVLSKRRGAIISKDMANQHGIRVEFYGKGNFNAEKQDMIIDYMVFNSLKVGMAMTLGSQVLSALIKGYDDDPEKDKWSAEELDRLKTQGIDVIQSIPVSRRVKYFFGDPTSKEGSPNKSERWKDLPVFVAGKFYGYKGANYKETAAFMNRTGLEPMTIYAYGKKVMKYSDNPILFSLFSDQGALFDELIFKESDNIRAEANGLLWGIKSVALSSLTSLESVKEQSMLRPFNEMYSAAFGEGMYSTDDKNFGERGLYYLERQAGNLIASGLLPAEVRNIFKDIGYLSDWSQEDPRSFVEFMVYKMPIANDVFIENEKTDPFGFPVVWKLKRELPLGTNYLVDAFNELKFDKTGAKYIALFEDKGSKIHLDPNFTTYYKADKYGDVKKESFTLDQRKKARDLYKPIIRSVVEELGADNLATYNIILFEKMVKSRLDMYGGPSGYKRSILNDILGEEAASLSFIDEVDAVLSSKISDQAINMKIEEQIKTLRRTE